MARKGPISRASKRTTADSASTPPDVLTPTQHIARVVALPGHNVFNCVLPSGTAIIAWLPDRFRSGLWLKRGGYVVIDTSDAEALKDTKIAGNIINVVRDEREWRKMAYWPAEFGKERDKAYEDSDEEESVVGKMPPIESSEDEEQEERGN